MKTLRLRVLSRTFGLPSRDYVFLATIVLSVTLTAEGMPPVQRPASASGKAGDSRVSQTTSQRTSVPPSSRDGHEGDPSPTPHPTTTTVFFPPIIMNFPPFSGGGSRPPDPAKVLDSEGPQFPDTFNMSDFSMIAYVKGGWPMVIDYQLERAAIVLLSIAAEGIEPFYYHLDGRNIARHQEKLTIPPRFGEAAKPARYSIRALSAATGEVTPVYLRLFGLGAGPRAVGSLKIDDLRFTPGTIHPAQKEKANYSFHSHDDFTRAEAEFWSVGRLPGGPVIPTRVDVEKIKDSVHRDEQVANTWEGKHKGKPVKGQFQLQVCGWVDGRAGGDWAIALSGQLVTVD